MELKNAIGIFGSVPAAVKFPITGSDARGRIDGAHLNGLGPKRGPNVHCSSAYPCAFVSSAPPKTCPPPPVTTKLSTKFGTGWPAGLSTRTRNGAESLVFTGALCVLPETIENDTAGVPGAVTAGEGPQAIVSAISTDEPFIIRDIKCPSDTRNDQTRRDPPECARQIAEPLKA